MAWTIELSDDAEKDFARLDRQMQHRVYKYLHERIASAGDARSYGKPLQYLLAGLWRYRVGDYRIVCKVEEERLLVLVLEIAHRSEVYDR